MKIESTRLAAALQELPDTNRWTKLPDALLYVLTPREHQLMHLLLSHRWTPDAPIYPFVATMARVLGWPARTVQRTLRSLEAGGWIVTEARFRESDKGQTSNQYHPGPMLLPYLASVDAEADGRQDQAALPPVTPRAGLKRDTNHQTRNTASQGGYTPAQKADKCFGCGGRHGSEACPTYGRMFARR